MPVTDTDDTYSIVKIRRGKGARSGIIYANVENQKGELCVSATLEYCTDWVKENV